jgi:hypothetical protein
VEYDAGAPAATALAEGVNTAEPPVLNLTVIPVKRSVFAGVGVPTEKLSNFHPAERVSSSVLLGPLVVTVQDAREPTIATMTKAMAKRLNK